MFGVEDDTKLVVALYVAVGFALVSVLHSWYVADRYGFVRFGIPFLEIGVGAPAAYGYVGALALGAFAWVLSTRWLSTVPPLSELSDAALFSVEFGGPIVAGTSLLLVVSQVFAGASWSKVILEVVLVFCAALVLLSSVRPLSLWNVLSLYAAVVSVLLTVGNAWIDFTGQLAYPNFPAFAYFAISSVYVLAGSFVAIAPNNLEGTRAVPTETPSTDSDRPGHSTPTIETLSDHRDEILASLDAAESPVEVRTDLIAFFALATAVVETHSVQLLCDHLASGDDKRLVAAEFFRTRFDQRRREDLLFHCGVIDADLHRNLRGLQRASDQMSSGWQPPSTEAHVRRAVRAVGRLVTLESET